eukprot:NODE_253_length_11722_cov_0.375118.p4 type:complete len:310 gc:universal NODE_253_length_11722_cov_0.375118:8061-8990(+)
MIFLILFAMATSTQQQLKSKINYVYSMKMLELKLKFVKPNGKDSIWESFRNYWGGDEMTRFKTNIAALEAEKNAALEKLKNGDLGKLDQYNLIHTDADLKTQKIEELRAALSKLSDDRLSVFDQLFFDQYTKRFHRVNDLEKIQAFNAIMKDTVTTDLVIQYFKVDNDRKSDLNMARSDPDFLPYSDKLTQTRIKSMSHVEMIYKTFESELLHPYVRHMLKNLVDWNNRQDGEPNLQDFKSEIQKEIKKLPKVIKWRNLQNSRIKFQPSLEIIPEDASLSEGTNNKEQITEPDGANHNSQEPSKPELIV